MEVIIGIGGILALGVFALVFGTDIQAIAAQRRDRENGREINDDPHSTVSVTRQVLSEIGDREPCR